MGKMKSDPANGESLWLSAKETSAGKFGEIHTLIERSFVCKLWTGMLGLQQGP